MRPSRTSRGKAGPAVLRRVQRVARAALLSAALPLGTSARAAFQTPMLTPRAQALGGAALPDAGDAAALFVNPAGIEGLGSPQAYFTYTDLFAGLSGIGTLDTGFAALAIPTRLGTLGLGAATFNASGLLSERTLALGYAKTLWGGIQAGLSGKNLYEAYTPGGDPLAAQDPVFAKGTSRSVFAVDAGVIAPVGDSLKLGLSVRNLNQPNVGLATTDLVEREYEAGAAWNVLGVTLFADLDFPNDSLAWSQAIPSIGLEKILYQRIAFRLGANPTQLTGGIGVRLGRMELDYAFVLDSQIPQEYAGTQTVGLRLAFGGVR